MSNFSRGSEWRKWDLHIHSPYTHLNNKYEDCTSAKLIKQLQEKEISVVGYTNYFKFHNEDFETMEKLRKHKITVFPNLEFRYEQKNKDSEYIHFHILFSESVEPDAINGLLSRLKTVGNLYCTDLKGEDIKNALISFDTLKKTLKDESEKIGNQYILIAAPRGQGNFRPSQSDDGRGNYLAKIIDKKIQIVFGNKDDSQFFLDQSRFPGAKAKPVFLCSDAHELSTIGTKYTWVKADPTWEGLKLSIENPKERINVSKPQRKLDTETDTLYFIKQLEINKNPTSSLDPNSTAWFQDPTKIEFNSGLIAIIGKKGSGKSALLDLIALTSNSNLLQNEPSFSFLSRFNGETQRQDAFNCNLVWSHLLDGKNETKRDSLKLEYKADEQSSLVKYLPQSYIEKLCSDKSTDNFKQEIEEVIFSHVPTGQKKIEENKEASSFQELIKWRQESTKKTIERLIQNLSNKNEEITKLESHNIDQEIKQVNKNLEKIDDEIAKLNEEKQQVEKSIQAQSENIKTQTDNLNEKQKQTQEKINKLQSEIQELDKKIDTKNEDKESLQSEIEGLEYETNELANAQSEIQRVQRLILTELSDLEEKYQNLLQKHIEVQLNDFIKVEIKDNINQQFETAYDNIQNKIKNKQQNQPRTSSEPNQSIQSLDQEIDKLQQEKIKKEQEIDTIMNQQEGSLQIIQRLNEDKEELENKVKTLKENLQQKEKDKLAQNSIIEELAKQPSKLTEQKELRLAQTKQIFEEKQKIQKIYELIQEGIKNKIDEENKQDESNQLLQGIHFSAVLKIDKARFKKKMVESFINGNKIRDLEKHFENQLKAIANKPITREEGLSFIQDILKILDQRGTGELAIVHDICKGGHNPQDVYNYLYSLEYLEPTYEIKFEGAGLEALSPGQKGHLLFAFHLGLDQTKNPLLIDQPEENLDNQTIYKNLVPLIKRAKEHRQVFIVTHNPNIAVSCDAEQVIYADFDNKNWFNYESRGSIENPKISSHLVNILEGTKPAFDQRDKAYQATQKNKAF